MSARMTIDWWPAGQIAELQAFLDRHWQRGHVLVHDAELLRWQHRLPGDLDLLSVLVAREGEQIVGALGLIVVSFCARGRRSPGAWLTTWIATPAARERQAGLRLMRRALDEPFGFLGTVGANQTALRMYRALGFSICESLPRWVRVISQDALATLLGDRAAAHGEPPPQAPASDLLRISPWSDAFAPRWDAMWAQRLAPRLVGTWRDAAYLRWRYLEHPRFTYNVRVAEDAEGSLRGLAVHRIAEVRGAVGRVVRIVELLGDCEAATALASDAVAAGVRTRAAFAEFYCTAAGVAEPLRACGFTLESERCDALPALFEPLDFGAQRLTGAFRVGAELGDDPMLLESGTLEPGTFEPGTFQPGTFQPGTLESGTLEPETSEPGTFQPGTFEPGTFYVTRSDCDQDRPNRLA